MTAGTVVMLCDQYAVFQTQANLLDAVVEMNTRQTNVERRADNIEDSLRCLQVSVPAQVRDIG